MADRTEQAAQPGQAEQADRAEQPGPPEPTGERTQEQTQEPPPEKPAASAKEDEAEPSRRRRLLWHGAATLVLAGVVRWAFAWQLSALQWLGLLLIAIVLWHALQGRGRMRPVTRWIAAAAVLAAGGATLPLDQPWNAPWWPGSTLAGSVPDPCETGTDHLPALVPRSGPPIPGGYSDLRTDWQTCGWRDEGRLLYLEFRRYPWQGTDDKSVPAARRDFAERRDHADARPLDIGEEAYADPLDDTRLTIQSRQSNVIVTVRYYAVDEAAPLTEAERAELTRFAETATAAVTRN
jgi:hypothetical protein